MLEYAAPIWHPYHETQIGQVEKVQRTAARWTCRRWRNTSSVGDMLEELEWPSLETRRKQSSLAFFYKIHSCTVSLDKDKYLTPEPNLMHQSFVSPATSGLWNSGAFNFLISKALLKAVYCGATFVVKALRKAPTPEADNIQMKNNKWPESFE